jgi:response regulator RpfG family c-di-GMP phosphodiesterase
MTTIAEEKVNILLVDDQTSNLLALESILTDMDLNLVRAESGRGGRCSNASLPSSCSTSRCPTSTASRPRA